MEKDWIEKLKRRLQYLDSEQFLECDNRREMRDFCLRFHAYIAYSVNGWNHWLGHPGIMREFSKEEIEYFGRSLRELALVSPQPFILPQAKLIMKELRGFVPADEVGWESLCLRSLKFLIATMNKWYAFLKDQMLVDAYELEELKQFAKDLRDFAKKFLKFDLEASQKRKLPPPPPSGPTQVYVA